MQPFPGAEQPIDDHLANDIALGRIQNPTALDLTPGVSYRNLVQGRRGLVSLSPGMNANGAVTKPYQYGSHKSKLVAMLRKGHSKVALTADELELIIAWIDANAPSKGSARAKRTGGRYKANTEYLDYPWKPLWAPPREWPAIEGPPAAAATGG